MHASTTQLIAMRDREPVDAAIHEHVEHCDVCMLRLQQYKQMRRRLASLVVEPPPAHAWQQILERRALETIRHASPGRDIGRNAGIAAALLLVIAVTTLVYFQPSMPQSADEQQVASRPTIRALQQQSRELEYALQEQAEVSVMTMHTAGTISELEDSIAFIDYELANVQESEQQRDLWQQRVELMQMLMMVRSAHQYASSI